jgi:hypothetical protein
MHTVSFFFFILILISSSCSSPTLSVQTEYFRPADLASVHVHTPDPEKDANLFGQHIYIYWTLSSSTKQDRAALDIKVRLQNGELQEKVIPITDLRGVFCYQIVGDDFTKKGGLLSYLIELKVNGSQVAVCKHTFWVEALKA